MRTHRCRFACFTIAQWEKEAAWLRQQHQKGWQFTHLTAGVFYHFAACPPEDVVYHLEYQDQKDLGGGTPPVPPPAGVGLCGSVHPVLLLPQAQAKDISPGGGRPPPEPRRPAGDAPPGVLGADVPSVPFGGRGVPAPVRSSPRRWTRTVALLFALVLVAYGAVFLQFARQYLRLRRAV